MAEAAIRVAGVSHHFGTGELRKQILHDIHVTVQPGEIVILTGPSGSGKTTLLTLMGALRTVQEGSLEILGTELHGAPPRVRRDLRRSIGYIFQQHNLLDALTAEQNVQMALNLRADLSVGARLAQAREKLAAVGLAEHAGRHPGQLSGGQNQRVAIARALANEPRIVLADEPTAALDKQTGRDIVDILQRLAKRQGCAILLVTHDNRILDIADRLIALEDGRLSSFTQAVVSDNVHFLEAMRSADRGGEFEAQLAGLDTPAFLDLLQQATREYEAFLHTLDLVNDETSGSLLDQVLEACSGKMGQLVGAERVSVFLLDSDTGEIWSKVATTDAGPLEIRIPRGSGIVGEVIETGEPIVVADAYADPRFNREVDARSGFRTNTILCLPVKDAEGRTFAAVQLVNKAGGLSFDAADARLFAEFGEAVGVLLQCWVGIHRHRETRRRETYTGALGDAREPGPGHDEAR